MERYANQTSVSPDRSRAEIERILARYGASGFMYGWTERGAALGFMLNNRQYKVLLKMPERTEFMKSEKGRRRTPRQADQAFDQATRQRWRAMALVIKAKLEAVQSNISTVESEFLAWMVLPNGETVGQWMGPQLDSVYKTGKMPPLLPGGDGIVNGEVV
jgi:hypothetical protein